MVTQEKTGQGGLLLETRSLSSRQELWSATARWCLTRRESPGREPPGSGSNLESGTRIALEPALKCSGIFPVVPPRPPAPRVPSRLRWTLLRPVASCGRGRGWPRARGSRLGRPPRPRSAPRGAACSQPGSSSNHCPCDTESPGLCPQEDVPVRAREGEGAGPGEAVLRRHRRGARGLQEIQVGPAPSRVQPGRQDLSGAAGQETEPRRVGAPRGIAPGGPGRRGVLAGARAQQGERPGPSGPRP